MVRTLDADRNAAFEKKYTASYAANRPKRGNVRTAGSSAAARNPRAAGTARETYGKNSGRTAARTASAGTSGRADRMDGKTVRTPDRSLQRSTGGRTAEPPRTESRGVRIDEASLGASGTEVRVPRTAMSFQTVIVMLALITIMTVILVFYITLQAEVTNTSQQIADLEQQLTQLKAENDASYNDITDSISLEEVRRRAIQDLGMKYADRDQVVIYSGTEKDTVHQVSSLNDN